MLNTGNLGLGLLEDRLFETHIRTINSVVANSV